jgi:hypothetical protein
MVHENFDRLASRDFSYYQTIAERNFFRASRGGVDQATITRLTAILKQGEQRQAWFEDNPDRPVKKMYLGDTIHAGSFTGVIVEIYDDDIVLDRAGTRWLLSSGESLAEAFALPPETGDMVD